MRKFKNRNNRSAAGAYEQSGQRGGPRGFGPLDPDEAWDTRVGNEADAYGYYEEQELGGHSNTGYPGASGGAGGGYSMNLASTPGVPDEEPTDGRGRKTSRSPGPVAGGRNPFDDDAEASLRGVSPRPMDAPVRLSGQ